LAPNFKQREIYHNLPEEKCIPYKEIIDNKELANRLLGVKAKLMPKATHSKQRVY
jgi:hypothetical protein